MREDYRSGNKNDDDAGGQRSELINSIDWLKGRWMIIAVDVVGISMREIYVDCLQAFRAVIMMDVPICSRRCWKSTNCTLDDAEVLSTAFAF